MKRAVFLDRDGTINESPVRNGVPSPPRDAAELELAPGAAEALARLKAAGFLLIVVSNQPDVARGTVARETVDAINAALARLLPLDEFRVCCHDDRDGCACRKPRPGLLLEAAAEHGVNLAASYMVGDRWKDVDAGAAAGCRTVLIERDYEEREPSRPPDWRVGSLVEAVDAILR